MEALAVIAILIVSLILSIPKFLNAQSNINTPQNFPDPNFRRLIESYMGVQPGGKFSTREAASKKSQLIAMGGSIESVKGIEFFTGLEELQLEKCDIETLDISKNVNLLILSCRLNLLKELDVSKNPKLWIITCTGNLLTSLDVTHNPNLRHLECSVNQITNLNLSNNPELRWLDASNNRLESLNLSYNTRMEHLDLSNNPIYYDPNQEIIPQLQRISIEKNQFQKIPNLSKITTLRYLDVRNNPLTLETQPSLSELEKRIGVATFSAPYGNRSYLQSGFAFQPDNKPDSKAQIDQKP